MPTLASPMTFLPGSGITSTMNKPLILGIGEILWDNLPGGRVMGGAPANFAYHAAALGACSLPVSCVGNDADGRAILDRVRSMGLDTAHLTVDPHHRTGTVDVTLDPQGVPNFTIHQDVAWDYIRTTDALLSAARQADCVCFGSLAQRCPVSRNSIQAALAQTRPDCLRIFDINLRQNYFSREVVEASLVAASVLKLNDQELPVVGRLLEINAEAEQIIERLLTRYNLRLIALTRGGEGSSLYASGQRNDHRGFKTTIADTVGAGDCFTAAVAIGLLRGDVLSAINEKANRLAAYVCSRPGATPQIPAELL